MAARKAKAAPKQPLPPKFIASYGNYVVGRGASPEVPLRAAAKEVNDRYRQRDIVGIYQLVQVVRRVVAPVEVEVLAECEPCKKGKI